MDQKPDSSQRRMALLPDSLPPLGLSRVQVAAYIGVSPTLFDELVRDGRMPPPKRINRRRLWDRRAIESAFAEFPDSASAGGLGGLDDDDANNPWGDG
jgi:predicted DNA-binding transcriptional regulator AlpA